MAVSHILRHASPFGGHPIQELKAIEDGSLWLGKGTYPRPTNGILTPLLRTVVGGDMICYVYGHLSARWSPLLIGKVEAGGGMVEEPVEDFLQQ